MKANNFKKLRSKAIWYDVKVTPHLFGSLYSFDGSIRVLARNAREAVKRAYRRGYGIDHMDSCCNSTTSRWAHWMVKRSDKSDNFRNVIYYGN